MSYSRGGSIGVRNYRVIHLRHKNVRLVIFSTFPAFIGLYHMVYDLYGGRMVDDLYTDQFFSHGNQGMSAGPADFLFFREVMYDLLVRQIAQDLFTGLSSPLLSAVRFDLCGFLLSRIFF